MAHTIINPPHTAHISFASCLLLCAALQQTAMDFLAKYASSDEDVDEETTGSNPAGGLNSVGSKPPPTKSKNKSAKSKKKKASPKSNTTTGWTGTRKTFASSESDDEEAPGSNPAGGLNSVESKPTHTKSKKKSVKSKKKRAKSKVKSASPKKRAAEETKRKWIDSDDESDEEFDNEATGSNSAVLPTPMKTVTSKGKSKGNTCSEYQNKKPVPGGRHSCSRFARPRHFHNLDGGDEY